jgi:hypothetical protein
VLALYTFAGPTQGLVLLIGLGALSAMAARELRGEPDSDL